MTRRHCSRANIDTDIIVAGASAEGIVAEDYHAGTAGQAGIEQRGNLPRSVIVTVL